MLMTLIPIGNKYSFRGNRSETPPATVCTGISISTDIRRGVVRIREPVLVYSLETASREQYYAIKKRRRRRNINRNNRSEYIFRNNAIILFNALLMLECMH